MFGLDTVGILILVGVAILLFLLVDLLLAGGGMTTCITSGMGAMMGGASSVMGTPWGWLLLAAVAFIAFQFLSPFLAR